MKAQCDRAARVTSKILSCRKKVKGEMFARSDREFSHASLSRAVSHALRLKAFFHIISLPLFPSRALRWLSFLYPSLPFFFP